MFLVNRGGKVLLVHSSGKYARNLPWMPPKEEIQPDETPLEAAQRAIVEELHLNQDSYQDIESLSPVTYKSKSKMVWCFAARYLGRDDDIYLDWENDKYGWFTTEEAREIIKEEYVPLLDSLKSRI